MQKEMPAWQMRGCTAGAVAEDTVGGIAGDTAGVNLLLLLYSFFTTYLFFFLNGSVSKVSITIQQ